MTVVQICLGKDGENKAVGEEDFKEDFGESQLLEMLNTLFDPGMNPQRKLEKLENDYQIPMENKLGEELNQMCNLSDYVEEIGIQKGLKQGLAEGMTAGLTAGMEQGRMLILIQQVQKKYQKNKSLPTIADEVEEDIQFVEKLYELVKDHPDKSAEEIYQMM